MLIFEAHSSTEDIFRFFNGKTRGYLNGVCWYTGLHTNDTKEKSFSSFKKFKAAIISISFCNNSSMETWEDYDIVEDVSRAAWTYRELAALLGFTELNSQQAVIYAKALTSHNSLDAQHQTQDRHLAAFCGTSQSQPDCIQL